jgi:NTP pyrophosphatase (non-canonical NTP hydrolase)
MRTKIKRVKAWAKSRGITGPDGSGTRIAQAGKMMEEAVETLLAVGNYGINPTRGNLLDVKDGIGDTIVTLVILAEMYDLDIEECLEHALQVIEARTGKMENGQFIKDK